MSIEKTGLKREPILPPMVYPPPPHFTTILNIHFKWIHIYTQIFKTETTAYSVFRKPHTLCNFAQCKRLQ